MDARDELRQRGWTNDEIDRMFVNAKQPVSILHEYLYGEPPPGYESCAMEEDDDFIYNYEEDDDFIYNYEECDPVDPYDIEYDR